MARKIVIDVEARFNDQVTDDAKSASDSIDNLGKKAKQAGKETDNLGKKKAKPIFDAENSRFIKKIRDAEAKARKFGKTKTATVLDAVDKASSKIGNVMNKARGFAGRVWSATVNAKDKASSILSKVSTLARGVAGKTWSAMVKIKDYATTPLTKIKNALFSIKGLIAAVTAGLAAKTVIMEPIGLADAYSSAKIGFQTLLGEERGQQMMDDLDQFAKATPFGTSQVIAQSQKMLAMGWNAEDILTDLQTIGDAAAATGKGEEGLQRITLALSQIKSKGKLSTEELNQLAEAGISAKRYLAEGLGYGTGDEGLAKMTKDLENGAIGADKAIQTIIEGMKEYNGMMQKTANETVSGLWSQIKDTFEINIFRKWGQGLQDGAKRGLGKVVELLDTADDTLKDLGDTVYAVGKSLSNWAADKLEKAVNTIKEVTNTDAFKQASLGGKIKILWSEVITEPFSAWWNSEGKQKVAKIASDLGESIGTGITGGLLVLLGLNAEDALGEGVSLGGAFMDGFLEGFDTTRITKALRDWASNNKMLAATLGTYFGIKMLSGLGGIVGNIKGLFGSGSGGLGGLGGSYATMNVTAGLVNLYVSGTGQPLLGDGSPVTKKGFTEKIKGLFDKITPYIVALLSKFSKIGALLAGLFAKFGAVLGGLMSKFGLALGAKVTGAGLTAVGTASTAGIAGIAAGVISSGVDVVQGIIKGKKGDKKGAKDEYFSAGTKIGMTGAGAGLGALLGTFVFPGIGTGAGALIGGGVGGLVSTFAGSPVGKALSNATDEGGWLNNAWKGTKNFFEEDPKRKVGGGIGSAIGGVLGTLFGGPLGTSLGALAGGAIGSLLTTPLVNFFTKTLPKGWNSLWDNVSTFFTETIPEAWGKLKSKVGPFFTEAIPEKWNDFWDGVGKFFSETVPTAWSNLKEKVGAFFTETIPEKWNQFWDNVGSFLTEDIPYAIGYATGKIGVFFTETIPEAWNKLWDPISEFFTETIPEAWDMMTEKVKIFFTETLPDAWDSLWDPISAFFTETIPAAWETLKEKVSTFFTETLPEAWNGFWGMIGDFFTETIPGWADTIWNGYVVPFFTESVPQFFGLLWENIKTFFTETIPEWASITWEGFIVPFFTVSIPNFFSNLWENIKTFFTETIPAWAELIWSGHIVPFFTESIPTFFGNLWDSIAAFFTEALPTLASNIWGSIKTFFTDTIPGWAKDVIENVKSSFGAGKSDAESGKKYGSSKGEYRGGIVGGGSSSLESFARGGMIRGNLHGNSHIQAFGSGGMVHGGGKIIRVAEEGTAEMIIPLGSHRRQRGLDLWEKAGHIMGVPGFARGGIIRGGLSDGSNEPSIRTMQYGSTVETGGQDVLIEVGGITVEIHVDATGKTNIAEAIKEQANEIAEAVAGAMADALAGQFENTPVKGGSVA